MDQYIEDLTLKLNELASLIEDYREQNESARHQKQIQIEELLEQAETLHEQANQEFRQMPQASGELREFIKQSKQRIEQLRGEFENAKRQATTDVNERATEVAKMTEQQAGELGDINRKVEMATMEIEANNAEIIRQDEQLDNTNFVFNRIQAKADNAGQLVRNMKTRDEVWVKWAKIVFVILSACNIIFGVILIVEKVSAALKGQSLGVVGRSFLPEMRNVADVTGQRELYVDYWLDML